MNSIKYEYLETHISSKNDMVKDMLNMFYKLVSDSLKKNSKKINKEESTILVIT